MDASANVTASQFGSESWWYYVRGKYNPFRNFLEVSWHGLWTAKGCVCKRSQFENRHTISIQQAPEDPTRNSFIALEATTLSTNPGLRGSQKRPQDELGRMRRSSKDTKLERHSGFVEFKVRWIHVSRFLGWIVVKIGITTLGSAEK